MFTVIFVNQCAEQQRRNYQFLFQPFIDANEMCFCHWLPEKKCIEEAVPDLYRLLRGKKDWRAIVLNMDSIEESKKQAEAEESKKQAEPQPIKSANKCNPFDYSHIDNDQTPHNSEIPLIRLTHMLAGYEYSTIREYEEVYEYFNAELDEKRMISKESFERFYHIQKYLDEMQIRYRPTKVANEQASENVEEYILDKQYLFASYCNEKAGKTLRISFDMIIRLLKFQNAIFQFDSQYLYEKQGADPEIIKKNSLYRTCQYLGDDCRISIFQQECIEYFILHQIEYQLFYCKSESDELLDIDKLYVEYMDERLRKTCRLALNEWYRIYRLFKLKSKNEIRLIYADDDGERELDREFVFIDNKQVRATRPIHFSIDELEDYHKLLAVGDETDIRYYREVQNESGSVIEDLDKHALFMESVDSGVSMSERLPMDCVDIFRVLQNHKNALVISYLPKSHRVPNEFVNNPPSDENTEIPLVTDISDCCASSARDVGVVQYEIDAGADVKDGYIEIGRETLFLVLDKGTSSQAPLLRDCATEIILYGSFSYEFKKFIDWLRNEEKNSGITSQIRFNTNKSDEFSDYLKNASDARIQMHDSNISVTLSTQSDISVNDILKRTEQIDDVTVSITIPPKAAINMDELLRSAGEAHMTVEHILEAGVSLQELMEIEDVLIRRDKLKLAHRAVRHDSEQIQTQRKLNKEYQFADNRPLEILLFATRHKSETDEKQTFSKAMRYAFDSERARFWEFNHYPVSCRFLYMDIMSCENSRFDLDLLNYWVAVLLMARQGAGSLKAYNLYKIRLDLNENNLNFALNRQLNILHAAFTDLKQELLLARDYSFKPNEMLFTPENVTVEFHRDKALEMLLHEKTSTIIEGDRNAALKDSRESSDKIANEKMVSLKTSNKQRVLDNKVKEIRQRSFEFVKPEYLLDDYQLKELQAQKTDYERKLIGGTYTPEEFEEIQRKAQLENEKKLEQYKKDKADIEKTKMTKDVVIKVCLVALGLIVVGNGTYIVQSAMQTNVVSENIYNLFISLVVTLVIVVFASLCAFYVFRQYEIDLKNADDQNKHIIDEINRSDERYETKYGDFYSNLLTYLKLQAMYLGMDAKKNKDVAARRRLLEYSRAIQNALERDEKWLRLFGLERIEVKKVYSDGFQKAPVKNSIFYFETALEDDFVRLNEHEQMKSAYPFIDHVWIERDYLLDDCDDNEAKG